MGCCLCYQRSAFGLEGLEAEAKVQETTAKAAVEKAKESAKAAHFQDDKVVAELVRNSWSRSSFVSLSELKLSALSPCDRAGH